MKLQQIRSTHTSSISRFQTLINDSFVPLRISGADPSGFRGSLRQVSVDDVHATVVRATPHVVERPETLIRGGEQPFLKVGVLLAGTCTLHQGGREAVLGPGDLAVYDTGRPYEIDFDREYRVLVLMFPQRAISLPPNWIGDVTALRVPASSGLGAIVSPFFARLATHFDQLEGPVGGRLAQTAKDLVSTVLLSEAGWDAAGGDQNRALMQRIHTYIDRHLDSPELSPTRIAAAHFISTRHLHVLFQIRGTSVSATVRSLRLERCRRDLADPMLADRSIAAIARRWGFGDAAHFSRIFKRAYGSSPRANRYPVATP